MEIRHRAQTDDSTKRNPHQRQKADQGCLGDGGRGTDCQGHRGLSGVTETLSTLIMVIDAWVYCFVKTRPFVRFK